VEIGMNRNDICEGGHPIDKCPHVLTIKEILEGFPDGPKNHGEYHKSLMYAAEAQRKFWADLSFDLKKNGIKGIILILLGLVVMKLFGTEALKFLWKMT
jgi:hypothetical protein